MIEVILTLGACAIATVVILCIHYQTSCYVPGLYVELIILVAYNYNEIIPIVLLNSGALQASEKLKSSTYTFQATGIANFVWLNILCVL